MPTGLIRVHEPGDTHFLTFSCFRRKPLLGTPLLRDTFQTILIDTVRKNRATLQGWVIMPEHIHLLIRPEAENTVPAIHQVIKQKYSRSLKKLDPNLYQQIQRETAHPPPMPVWETRSHNSNLRSPEAIRAVIQYIHHNPIKRGLAIRPEDWKWSSYHFHLEAANRRYQPGEELRQNPIEP